MVCTSVIFKNGDQFPWAVGYITINLTHTSESVAEGERFRLDFEKIALSAIYGRIRILFHHQSENFVLQGRSSRVGAGIFSTIFGKVPEIEFSIGTLGEILNS